MLIGICVALGIGLLAGAERERKKDTGPDRSAAGTIMAAAHSVEASVHLAKAGVSTSIDMVPGLGHGIDGRALRYILRRVPAPANLP